MRENLFGEVVEESVSIEVAALKANVSTASIRNWIKTGYLVKADKGSVTEQSLTQFMQEVAGNVKLKSRANKLQKDHHDHEVLTERITSNTQDLSGFAIGELYEGSLSNAHRNKEGVYYTPPHIIHDMLAGLTIKPTDSFLDPCCGSGNFIIQAIRKGVDPRNIYGFDIDPNAVEICKKRVFEETGIEPKNITVANFLDSAHLLQRLTVRYNMIFTNPPWGKKIEKQEKQRYATNYTAGKSLDTSSLFFFAALGLLEKGGHLGFLVQEAFFNISSYEDARKAVLQLKLKRAVNYGKAFTGIQANAQAFILERTASDPNTTIVCNTENSTHTRSNASFKTNPKQILNFWTTSEEAKVIDRIYSIPHETLANKAKWGLGIVTGNNKKFLETRSNTGLSPIFKGSDITRTGLKAPTNFIPTDFSHYQQVAPLELYNAEQKLIYKFISSQLVFFHDTEQRLILNSANLVIPDSRLSVGPAQLCSLFNSDLMNWVFTNLFNTHKILRGDLELLPIHSGYFNKYKGFNESDLLNFLGIEKTTNGSYGIKG